jgi:hypothetical protein
MPSFTAASEVGGGQKTVQPREKFLEPKRLQGHHENHPAGAAHCAQQFTNQMGEYYCTEGIPPPFRMSPTAAESFCRTNPLLL